MSTESSPISFQTFLRQALDRGGFQADDVLATVLPLFEAAAAAHESGLITGLRGTAGLRIDEKGALQLDPATFRRPDRNPSRIEALAPRLGGVEVVGEISRHSEIAEGMSSTANLDVAEPVTAISRPMFIIGYGCWEQVVAHHDPVTDIFLLGQLLASLACGLDFYKREDLESFAENRDNLFRLNDRLHPVIAKVIGQMTALDRHKRAQDLGQVVGILKNYRDQPIEVDLSRLDGYSTIDAAGRRRLIQAHLRDRLFEISRRNRLIYFKPSVQTLNLTLASVPLVMDVRNIKLEQLFIWHLPTAYTIEKGEAFSLGKYLRFEDAPYIPGVLDRLIAETRRDRAEYGFAQLRLVLCFLNWHNLKEEPEERITSPLLLLPVELTKRKGVRDAYVLQPVSAIAEVNPALRHHLKTLFGIVLPETVELDVTALDELYADLERQIRQSEPGVVLTKLDRPKIEVIHARARQRLDQWQRKQNLRPARKTSGRVEYSYDREDFRPLGLQLFTQKIRPQPFPAPDVNGAPPRPRMPGLVAENDQSGGDLEKTEEIPEEQKNELYSLHDDDSGNPYRWTFDLCSLTLGNFHYRKMTLVRDYTKLTEADRPNPSFDAVFSLEPRLADEESPVVHIADQFPVIPCDAAQAAAVARARTGRSFIIQGPPGTGKSQTITNLIADYVARGKRVLFVCEKRAAIDVVFHRLRQQGLDELCCRIHDSQEDKREFILDLKQTYERWLSQEIDTTAERTRERASAAMMHDLGALERFSEGMQAVLDKADVPLRALLLRLVEIGDKVPSLAPEVEELLPHYAVWLTHGSIVERLEQTMKRLGAGTCFARHPLRWLNRNAVQHPRPAEFVQRTLDQLEDLLDALESALELSGLPEELWNTLPEIGAILGYCGRVEALAARRQLALLDQTSPLAKSFVSLTADIVAADAALAAARTKTANWKDRLDDVDTVNALEAAQRFEHSRWRMLQPGYWRLRKTIEQRYDFKRHAVEPSLLTVLQDLLVEQSAVHRAAEARAHFEREFGGVQQAELETLLRETRGQVRELDGPLAVFHRVLLERGVAGDELVIQLAALRPKLAQLEALVQSVIETTEELDFSSLRQIVEEVRSELRLLPDLVPVLSELVEAPDELRYALCNTEVELSAFEAALARKTLAAAYRQESSLLRFDGRLFDAYLERLERHHREWLKSNAGTIRARVRRQFRENVQISNVAAGQLTDEQKAFKKEYTTGRRELEHELGKTMRYKSIRDLAAGPTGRVLRDIKPIWLMSPLSVSDTLPMEEVAFDVVIFDEASQIPLEEAIPAMYRASQIIVVGDQMQLPPTSFFASGKEGEETIVGEEDDRFEIDLEADSFLSQSARNLPSALLAWHYRSRYETLISFSNAAFYGGNLFTIPDCHLPLSETRELVVPAKGTPEPYTDALLARSISFHLIERGVYEHRRNVSEANYIALLVRDLLRKDTKLSIGIVAFSEAQQAEIESALSTLAEEDADFATRLEAEMMREKDDQFCGLFIKNLENVQGDERDIILFSICYGYDRQKRMLMNFGPINQRGGEKRLNVIFSRAKHHMAVVSSIRHTDITNEYNDGANALKNFLRYAENLSRGDHAGARTVLENLNPLARVALSPAATRDAVIDQVAARLRQRGHHVDLQVGQSRFRCDIAVRGKDAKGYALGVLVDTESHYRNSNLIDRYLTQPGILRAFGWKVAIVLTKDWLHEPEAVLERLERELTGALVPKAELPEIPTAETQAAEQSRARVVRTPGSQVIDSTPGPLIHGAGRGNSQRRYLELVEGSLKKFWEITVEGTSFTVRFGRIGTTGQTQQKVCGSDAEAKTTADDLARAKLSKGYRDVQR